SASVSSDAVNSISAPSKSFDSSSLLGSIFCFIISILFGLISKPITDIFFANSSAMGKPTYPSPTTANFFFLFTKSSYIIKINSCYCFWLFSAFKFHRWFIQFLLRKRFEIFVSNSDSLSTVHFRLPSQQLPGKRNIRLPLFRIVLRQRLIHYLLPGACERYNLFCELFKGYLIRITNVDR